MNIGQGFKMAFKSIMGNKLRTVLTMLGIIIGVTSVITLVSLGKGTSAEVSEQVQSLGSNLLTVNIMGRGATTTISYDDAMSLQKLTGVQYVAPVKQSSETIKYGTTSEDNVSVIGTNQDYLNVRQYQVANGRFIAPIDLEYYQKVAVVGSTVAQELFGFTSPVGQSIQINGIHFTVVGLLQSKGDSSSGDNDDVVMIPETTAERIFQSKGVGSVYVQATDADQTNLVVNELNYKMSQLFRGDTDSYSVLNQQDIINTMSSVSNTLSMALGGVAAISLLVGGIGIMNIMLVSVTERTREIGIRKAIGARKRDILLQFLIESIAMSGIGGLLGIALGVGLTFGIGKFTSITAVYSTNIILLSFFFSLAIGVIFGIFPANKAAKLKPIDALKFD
ncbi:ABC transporter permease [Pullulanibacillus sp. KACC 23026]|uniref:ABC transporter permease n=1 Tax=Pullulanibacillus sp. KACC 23026 TaxID=3028315 RepID=UPI0023B1B81D|nr:ABC transporter permease [Pullulanibacillus sp. KACC 23026]WEG13575.1 ABC transporter permease [Pullulanibacillus sp. KACC 23026]